MSDPIEAAAAAALAGELIVLPTDTVYGIGTRPDDPAATGRLFEAKGRPRELELPVLVASREAAERIALFDDRAAALAQTHWPGALTIVLRRAHSSRMWDLGGDARTVGVRIPDHRLALAVLARTGPLAVTSANRSGEATPGSCDDLEAIFGDAVKVYVCQPDAPLGVASTVVDLTGDAPRVLRQGSVAVGSTTGSGAEEARRMREREPSGPRLRERFQPRAMLDSARSRMAGILVVCTGNICRSPMAEAFLRRALVERLGADAPPVRSAGVIGGPGGPAMEESVRAAAERGADISTHVAARLDAAHVADADLIVTMAGEHRDAISRAAPDHARKTFTLKELVRLLEHSPPRAHGLDVRAAAAHADELRRGRVLARGYDDDVVDPLGSSLATYRAVALELDEWCERLAAALAGRVQATAGAEGE